MATHLLSGNDESVLRSAVHDLVDDLVGDGDRAIELLAQADLDLRGAKDLDPELVMEVLVARLSKLRR